MISIKICGYRSISTIRAIVFGCTKRSVAFQQAELTRSSFQPPPNKCVSDVPEWAGGAAGGGAGAGAGAEGEAGAARRKKDGLLQKATRWWVRMGARPAAPAPACAMGVMVPRRAAPPDA